MYYFVYLSTQLLLYLCYRKLILAICLTINLAVNPSVIMYIDWTVYPLQSLVLSMSNDLASWVILLVHILSNDIELSPGDYLNKGFLSFCTWNLNTLSKDNFQRVSLPLLEAHNALHNYDIISLYETSRNDTIELPTELLASYKFIPCNNPSGKKEEGGLFYKEILPLKVRNDLSFDECMLNSSLVVNIFFSQFCTETQAINLTAWNSQTSWKMFQTCTRC